jgi:hypothetical protein
MEQNIIQKLAMVQQELKAPKSQFNSFGNYKYRNQEDILEAVKPLLAKYKLGLRIFDTVRYIGQRYYIEATVQLSDLEAKDRDFITVTGLAREEETKKGMDASQITGSASSYARKYALNGLFLIDDTKDSDYTNGIASVSEVKPAVKTIVASSNGTITTGAGLNGKTCSKCNKNITINEATYSKKMMGAELCRDCQKENK